MKYELKMLATALRECFKEGYGLRNLRSDFLAGIVVSLVALPLSMALSIAVGLPPQHGLYTAIIAGIAAAIFGGSRTQVTGPTAAFVVVLAPIVAEFGLRGIIWCQILAGIMLLIMGISRIGKYINYIPYPVTTGFTAGIALVIFTLSLNDFLGLHIAKMPDSYIYKVGTIFQHLPNFNIAEAGVGILTMLIIIIGAKHSKYIPSPLIAIVAGSFLAYYLKQNGYDIELISERFKGGIPSAPPKLHYPGDGTALFSIPTLTELSTYFRSAFVIAALAGLESLLSASVADSMKGTKHNPNAELNGVGVANIMSGLFAGIPATGAIARTSTNIQSGANSPLASVFHSILILIYVLLLTPYINQIPMASLAALLVVVAYRMSHYKQFFRIVRIAPKSDIIVLLICFLLTVLVDMVAGVTAGIVIAGIMLIKTLVENTNITLDVKTTNERVALPDGVAVFEIDGPLFFGTAEKALNRYDFIKKGNVETMIIDIRNVPFVDITGLVALKSMIMSVAKRNVKVAICGKDKITAPLKKKLAESNITNVVFVDSIGQIL